MERNYRVSYLIQNFSKTYIVTKFWIPDLNKNQYLKVVRAGCLKCNKKLGPWSTWLSGRQLSLKKYETSVPIETKEIYLTEYELSRLWGKENKSTS